MKLSDEQGRIKITMEAIRAGEDICVVIYGGSKPHIGCATLSVPRPSLKEVGITSATTSVVNVIGHKDDEVARFVSHELCSKLNKNVVATCGIHVDKITEIEITDTITLLKKLTEKLIERLAYEV